MNMSTWAENEINIACKKENPNWDGESFDYGIACYKSALKAYNSLLEDEHSGFSWNLTMNILERLMRHEPLTPIEDPDFFNGNDIVNESESYLKEHDMKSSIQCPRMSSLFRNEYNDGYIEYTDVDRYYCFNINNNKDTYSGGGAASIIDELFPITMPYYPPTGKYAMACEEFLVDSSMGDFDTKAYYYVITPNNDKVEINKFYKEIADGAPITEYITTETLETVGEPDDEGMMTIKPVVHDKTYTYQPTKWVEISQEEFEERKKNKIN